MRRPRRRALRRQQPSQRTPALRLRFWLALLTKAGVALVPGPPSQGYAAHHRASSPSPRAVIAWRRWNSAGRERSARTQIADLLNLRRPSERAPPQDERKNGRPSDAGASADCVGRNRSLKNGNRSSHDHHLRGYRRVVVDADRRARRADRADGEVRTRVSSRWRSDVRRMSVE